MAKHSFSIQYTVNFVLIIMMIHVLVFATQLDLTPFCLIPRNLYYLTGILAMPLIHGSWEHLFSNILSFSFVSFILFQTYPRVARWVFWMGYLLTDILVWFIARGDSCHIGASGLIYAIAFFLIASGFIRKDFYSLIIAIAVVIFNGGLLAGILPIQMGVSWEGHLSGAMVGIAAAYLFRNIDRQEPVFQVRRESPDERFFEIFKDLP